MNVEFSDLYNICDCFRFSRKEVENFFRNLDQSQILNSDTMKICIGIKFHVDPNSRQSVIIIAHNKNDKWIIHLLLPFKNDLLNEIGYCEPLIILQAFVQRFGLMMKVGSHFNKFILTEQLFFPKKEVDISNLIKIVNPENHRYINCFLLNVDKDSNYTFCGLAFCIDFCIYEEWLFDVQKYDGYIIQIAPQCRGIITPRDIIENGYALYMQNNYENLLSSKNGWIFRISGPSYHFEVGISNDCYYILRNEKRIEMPFNTDYKKMGDHLCRFYWDDNNLLIAVADTVENDSEKKVLPREVKIQTLSTKPPNSLINWIQKSNIKQESIYNDNETFFMTIVSSVLSVQDKMYTINMYNPFWNIIYDGQKIAERIPKREIELQPIIHGFLLDLSQIKSYDIVPEFKIAGGNLDFLFVGSLPLGIKANVCTEFKLAHSDDVINGLVSQLPKYMRFKGCDYGIYVVLWFKCDWFNEPSKYNNIEDLKGTLEIERMKKGLDKIRILVLDLSPLTAPSKIS